VGVLAEAVHDLHHVDEAAADEGQDILVDGFQLDVLTLALLGVADPALFAEVLGIGEEGDDDAQRQTAAPGQSTQEAVGNGKGGSREVPAKAMAIRPDREIQKPTSRPARAKSEASWAHFFVTMPMMTRMAKKTTP